MCICLRYASFCLFIQEHGGIVIIFRGKSLEFDEYWYTVFPSKPLIFNASNFECYLQIILVLKNYNLSMKFYILDPYFSDLYFKAQSLYLLLIIS